MKRGLAVMASVVVGVMAWLAPRLALACPYCAAGSRGGTGQRVALGFFLLLPFLVAGVVYSVLRREAE